VLHAILDGCIDERASLRNFTFGCDAGSEETCTEKTLQICLLPSPLERAAFAAEKTAGALSRLLWTRRRLPRGALARRAVADGDEVLRVRAKMVNSSEVSALSRASMTAPPWWPVVPVTRMALVKLVLKWRFGFRFAVVMSGKEKR
jgi:hypothetical protein